MKKALMIALGMMMMAPVYSVMAADDDPKTICEKQAKEDGVTGADKDEYIKECIKELSGKK